MARWSGAAASDMGGLGLTKTTPKIRLLSNATTSYLSPVTHRPYLAVIQYDGANFVGWQRQPVGRSVQAEFEAVAGRAGGRRGPPTRGGGTPHGGGPVGPSVRVVAGAALGPGAGAAARARDSGSC